MTDRSTLPDARFPRCRWRRRSSSRCSGAKCCKQHSHWPVILALIGLSFVCSLMLLSVRSQWRIGSTSSRQTAAGNSVDSGRLRTVVTLWTWADSAARTTSASRSSPPRVAAVAGRRWQPRFQHRRHAAGRCADGHHALHGHVRLDAGGDLRHRLHARRPRLLAVLRLHRRCSCSR